MNQQDAKSLTRFVIDLTLKIKTGEYDLEKGANIISDLIIASHKDTLRESEEQKHSFARSQAIEFEEWYWSENCPYYWMGGTYSHGETNEVVSTSELYSLFLSHQAKQKEGKGE